MMNLNCENSLSCASEKNDLNNLVAQDFDLTLNESTPSWVWCHSSCFVDPEQVKNCYTGWAKKRDFLTLIQGKIDFEANLMIFSSVVFVVPPASSVVLRQPLKRSVFLSGPSSSQSTCRLASAELCEPTQLPEQ